MADNSLIIILVEPQLGQNIGAVARVMLNFGLSNLRIVSPRDGWPNPEAIPTAAGADQVLESAEIYSSTQDAISDLHRIFATTSRSPDLIKSIYSPKSAIEQLNSTSDKTEKVGILFGGERCGLMNEHISLSEAIIKIPTSDTFSSLNLAQSVALIAYEWFLQASSHPSHIFRTGNTTLATHDDLENFFLHLEDELERTGFLRHKKKRATMVRNIRGIFERACLTEQEVRTLRGIVRSLTKGKMLSKQKKAKKQHNFRLVS